MRKASKGLTKRQSDILRYIRISVEKRSVPPTVKEICDNFGLASTNGVHQHLKALEKKGFIKRISRGASRGIMILEKSKTAESQNQERPPTHIRSITIIGDGAAEDPMSPFFTNKGQIDIDSRYMDMPANTFADFAPDNGMKSEGIAEGDVLLIAHEQAPAGGNIVLALLNDRKIVRRLQKRQDQRILKASSKGYPKIEAEENDPSVTILGKVIGVVKKL